MLRRLQTVKPQYQVTQWVEDWQRNAKLTDMITTFPSKPPGCKAGQVKFFHSCTSRDYGLQYLSLTYTVICFFFNVKIVSSGAKIVKIFRQKFYLPKNEQCRRWPTNYSNNIRTYRLHFLFICDTWVSLHLLLSTSFCLHDSLERNVNFVHKFRTWKITHWENFRHKMYSSENVIAKIFLRELVGIKITANEIKVNYGSYVDVIL